MKYLYSIILLANCNLGNSQVLSKLTYSNSSRTYIAPPTNARVQVMRNIEARYLANKKLCQDLENEIRKNLKSLQSEDKNVKYREGLNSNLNILLAMKEEGFYEDYTMVLDDVANELRNVELLKEEE
ncbi:hypothetical protein [Flavobacterium microcysteis]|uniref:Uncharacterized protein n=1 Tax=Flavobacterium microcysteis TaxID=2596891 RepID=A0A501QGS5_9FLAO|nr:hypothetical protein [Flavobacterium microcysteis]TPD71116.1 hypothetical protein FJA49_04240 [Flavobacterium microcysteis]